MRRAALLALLALLSGGGCAPHPHVTYPAADAAPRIAFLPIATSRFDTLNHRPDATDAPAGEERHYQISEIALSSAGDNGQQGNLMTARYFQGKGAGAKPLIIVLPIWGVSNYPSNAITDGLKDRADGSVNVLQVGGAAPLFDWNAIGAVADEAEFFALVDQMVERFVATVIDIRHLVDWAETRPEVDPQRIALIGFSMGAVVASVALAHEPRLAAGILVMGGADLHEILAACDHEIEAAREGVLTRLGWSLERFKTELAPRLAPINPARFAGIVDPHRVLIIEAGADTCMPKSAREDLWKAFGRPERVIYRYDHRMAFLAMTFLGGYDLQRHVYRFLDRVLAAGESDQITADDAVPARKPRTGPG